MKKIYLAALLIAFVPILASAATAGPGGNGGVHTNIGPLAQVFSQSNSGSVTDPGFVWGFYNPATKPATPYVITFTCVTGCDWSPMHDMTITGFNRMTGGFTATGVQENYPSITWTGNGTTTISSGATGAIVFHIAYDPTSGYPGYTVDATGTIANDGTLSGTATDHVGDTFTWTMNQKAKPMPTFTDASSCSGFNGFKNATLIGSSTASTTDPDARLDGSVWAQDTFAWNLKIFQLSSTTPSTTPASGQSVYCALQTFEGSYTTPKSTSTNEAGPNINYPSSTILGNPKTTGDFAGSEIVSFTASSTDVTNVANTSDIFGWMNDFFPDAVQLSQNQVWAYGNKMHMQQWIETYASDSTWANYGNITNP